MALTLGNPTLISDAARNAQADAFDTLINGGAAQTLRLRNATTTLVTFTLNTTAAFGAAASGAIALASTPIAATASAGTATVPNNYEILADASVHWTGAVTGADGITTGQTVNLTSFTITWPAS
jgi:hypothetical protein